MFQFPAEVVHLILSFVDLQSQIKLLEVFKYDDNYLLVKEIITTKVQDVIVTNRDDLITNNVSIYQLNRLPGLFSIFNQLNVNIMLNPLPQSQRGILLKLLQKNSARIHEIRFEFSSLNYQDVILFKPVANKILQLHFHQSPNVNIFPSCLGLQNLRSLSIDLYLNCIDFSLLNLTYLSVQNGCIANLPRNLQVLNLEGCDFCSYKTIVPNLVFLSVIKCDNDLNFFKRLLTKSTNLKQFIHQSNHNSTFQESDKKELFIKLFELPNLESIIFHDYISVESLPPKNNVISRLEINQLIVDESLDFQEYTHLNHIHINQLILQSQFSMSFPQGLVNLCILQFKYQSPHLFDWNSIQLPRNLQNLTMSNGNFYHLPENLPLELIYIDFSYNKITKIPTFANRPHLKILKLNNNQIQYATIHCPGLQLLHMENNPIKMIQIPVNTKLFANQNQCERNFT